MANPNHLSDEQILAYAKTLEDRKLDGAIRLLYKPGCTITHVDMFCGLADITQAGDTHKRRKASEDSYFVIIGRYPNKTVG